MLKSVILVKPYGGVSAGFETSHPQEIAEQLIKDGIAIELPTAKVEPIKKGK
tara:strand:- start:334 stop:489 length:156 start_codon:yes stop_codon:yes gene_type:complete